MLIRILLVNAGFSVYVPSVPGDPENINLVGGHSITSGSGSEINITSGDGREGNPGGDINITSGKGGSFVVGGAGGKITITAGDGADIAGAGGDVEINGGASHIVDDGDILLANKRGNVLIKRDNAKLVLGATNNLTLYSDGTNGIIDVDSALRLGNDVANYTEIKNDGEINLHGTARVKKSLWLPFEALKAPGTKPADFVDHGIAGAWSFSDGTDDTIIFLIETPQDMDKSVAPTLKIGWSTNTTATDETAVWQLEYLWRAPGEDTTAGAQETLTIQSNAIAQSNGLIVAEFTGIDVPSETDVCLHCRLKRLGADADDDLSDTAELHGVCLNYIANKLGEAI